VCPHHNHWRKWILKWLSRWELRYRPNVFPQQSHAQLLTLYYFIKNFILKFGTHDYVWDIAPHANFWGRSARRRVLSKYVKYNNFMTVVISYRSFPQVKLRHWRPRLMAQTTCFRATRCLLGVIIKDDAIWEKWVSNSHSNKRCWMWSAYCSSDSSRQCHREA